MIVQPSVSFYSIKVFYSYGDNQAVSTTVHLTMYATSLNLRAEEKLIINTVLMEIMDSSLFGSQIFRSSL